MQRQSWFLHGGLIEPIIRNFLAVCLSTDSRLIMSILIRTSVVMMLSC